jgi:trimeric autotransporter adhesin
MSYQIQAERTDTNVPITLQVDKNGGVTGLTSVVQIRDGATTNSYLDFNDDTFKTAGWTTKQASLADIGDGVYVLSGGLDVSAITNLPAGTHHLFAEFDVTGSVDGNAVDVILLRNHVYDVAIAGDAMDLVTDAVDAAAIATGAIDADAIASDAITAAKIAADAIGASELATDAVNEIRDAILSDSTPFAGANINATISSRSSHSAADAADAVWDEAKAGHVGVGSFGEEVQTHATQAEILSDATPFAGANINATISSRSSHSASAVWDEALPGAHAGGTAGERLATTDDRVDQSLSTTEDNIRGTANRDLSELAGATWSSTTDTLEAIRDRIDDALIAAETAAVAGSTATEVRTGLTQADDFFNGMVLVVQNVAGTAARVIDDYANTNGAFSVATLPFTPAASDPVFVLAMDVSSAAEASLIATTVWSEAVPGAFGAGQAGKVLGDNLNATVSSRAAPGDAMDLVADAVDAAAIATGAIDADAIAADAITAAKIAPDAIGASELATDAVNEIRDAILSDSTPFAGANINATISSRSSHSAADVDTTLSGTHGAGSWEGASAPTAAAIADAVWDEAKAGHVAVGSFGEEVQTHATQAEILSDATPFAGANVDAAVSSRSSHSAADVDTTLSGTHGAGDWQGASAPAASAIADAVWDESKAGHVGVGSFGEEVQTHATQADILSDATPFAGANINATISSRSSHTAQDAATEVWSEAVPGAFGAGEAGKVLADIEVDTTELLARLTVARAAALDAISGIDADSSLVKKILVNKLELADGDVGNWILYDDNSTPLLTWNVVDKTGNPVVLPAQAPARRNKGV